MIYTVCSDQVLTLNQTRKSGCRLQALNNSVLTANTLKPAASVHLGLAFFFIKNNYLKLTAILVTRYIRNYNKPSVPDSNNTLHKNSALHSLVIL